MEAQLLRQAHDRQDSQGTSDQPVFLVVSLCSSSLLVQFVRMAANLLFDVRRCLLRHHSGSLLGNEFHGGVLIKNSRYAGCSFLMQDKERKRRSANTCMVTAVLRLATQATSTNQPRLMLESNVPAGFDRQYRASGQPHHSLGNRAKDEALPSGCSVGCDHN